MRTIGPLNTYKSPGYDRVSLRDEMKTGFQTSKRSEKRRRPVRLRRLNLRPGSSHTKKVVLIYVDIMESCKAIGPERDKPPLLYAGSKFLRMKTILLVDDDQQVREVFGLALRRSGYYVLEAHSGVAGLEMARQYLPDLILSDVLMPEGDGATLLRDIRRDPELKSTQVVLMTGSPDLVTPGKGKGEWADDFLLKPIGLQTLLLCVQARVRPNLHC
jgi:CheY-like chemotaxis protein